MFKSKNGFNEKEFIGKLTDYNEKEIFLQVGNEVIEIPIENISLMRQYIDFGGK